MPGKSSSGNLICLLKETEAYQVFLIFIFSFCQEETWDIDEENLNNILSSSREVST